jgi:hypothetical protein
VKGYRKCSIVTDGGQRERARNRFRGHGGEHLVRSSAEALGSRGGGCGADQLDQPAQQLWCDVG